VILRELDAQAALKRGEILDGDEWVPVETLLEENARINGRYVALRLRKSQSCFNVY